jgi:hypothetical protein
MSLKFSIFSEMQENLFPNLKSLTRSTKSLRNSKGTQKITFATEQAEGGKKILLLGSRIKAIH